MLVKVPITDVAEALLLSACHHQAASLTAEFKGEHTYLKVQNAQCVNVMLIQFANNIFENWIMSNVVLFDPADRQAAQTLHRWSVRKRHFERFSVQRKLSCLTRGIPAKPRFRRVEASKFPDSSNDIAFWNLWLFSE